MKIALPAIARLLPAARAAGVSVVHCVVQRRPDRRGSNHNAKLFSVGAGVDIAPDGPGTRLVPELDAQPSDLVLYRWHGIGPMGGTDLDAVLRNLGVTTIVAVGVSVNVAIPNLVMDAVNAAYRVVVPRHGCHRQHAVIAGDHHHHRETDGGVEATVLTIQIPGICPLGGQRRLESIA